MEEKLFKKDLAEMMAEEFGITKKKANDELDYLARIICEQLKDGKSITIKELGKFETVEKKARTAINPKTMEKIDVPAKKAVSFKASKNLKNLFD